MQFEINGFSYTAGKMDTFKQFHVARRLTPLLSSLAASKDAFETNKIFESIGNAISGMSDVDCDYILNACLSVVSRQQDARTSVPIIRNAQLMFDDIDLAVMMQIAVKVIQDNLGNFFPKAAASVIPSQTTTA